MLAGRQPLAGPVSNIASWNYPLSVLVHAMLVQVLAANTVIAKTPTDGGLCALTVSAALMRRYDLPVTLLSGSGLTQDTIWQLADALGPWRLSVAALGSVATLVAWLIADHELWERRAGPAARQGLPVALYNRATVLTVTLGVLCRYGALLVLNFVAAELFVVDPVLEQSLQHPSPSAGPPTAREAERRRGD